MKTILFPTDFSENAENALQYALAFALKMDTSILILNVCPIPYDFMVHIEEAIDSMEKFYNDKLQKLVKKIKSDEKYKSLTISAKTTSGSVVFSILEAVKRLKVDLIIMGTKGASGLEKYFFGSNTAEIIKRAEVPVLVVPKNATYHEFTKLIYAIDYREDELLFLQELTKLAKILGAKMETIHIAPKESLHEQILHHGLVQLIEDKISDIFTGHHLIVNKSFFKGVEEYLNNNPSSLLVMAHYKRTFLHTLLNNSVTEEMTYHTKTPLLIFNQEA